MSSGIISIQPLSILETVINVVFLFLILRHFLFKPVNRILKEREEKINADKNAAEKAKADAAAAKKNYEDQLGGIEAMKSEAVRESTQKANAEYDRIVADANKKASDILSQAQKKAENDAKSRKAQQDKKLADLVSAAAAKVAGAKGAELDSALYDEFISKAGEDSHE